jgi:hypothetical protein
MASRLNLKMAPELSSQLSRSLALPETQQLAAQLSAALASAFNPVVNWVFVPRLGRQLTAKLAA